MLAYSDTVTYITTIKKYFNKVDNTRQIGDLIKFITFQLLICYFSIRSWCTPCFSGSLVTPPAPNILLPLLPLLHFPREKFNTRPKCLKSEKVSEIRWESWKIGWRRLLHSLKYQRKNLRSGIAWELQIMHAWREKLGFYWQCKHKSHR